MFVEAAFGVLDFIHFMESVETLEYENLDIYTTPL